MHTVRRSLVRSAAVARAQASRTVTCTVTGPDGYQFTLEGFLTPSRG